VKLDGLMAEEENGYSASMARPGMGDFGLN